MVNFVKHALRKVGLQVKTYPDRDQRNRLLAMNNFNINKILDVGANTGQFVNEIRSRGFNGEIVSFEPLSSAFKILEAKSRPDKRWSVHNMAIGDTDGEIEINISENSQSSSILEMLPAHVASAPESKYIGSERATIHKLDTIFSTYYNDGDNIMLKVDTQGYEKNVIDGAMNSLSKIKSVKLEMSLIPLYKEEVLFVDMLAYMDRIGFRLYSLENTYADPKTGQILQVDGTFYRQKS
ncbi:FkbM family methyltransferase [soil metagenome]